LSQNFTYAASSPPKVRPRFIVHRHPLSTITPLDPPFPGERHALQDPFPGTADDVRREAFRPTERRPDTRRVVLRTSRVRQQGGEGEPAPRGSDLPSAVGESARRLEARRPHAAHFCE